MAVSARTTKARLTLRVVHRLKGWGDPFPEDGEAFPFWDFYALARDFGWRWCDYLATPDVVTEHLLLYHSIEAPLRAQQQQSS